MNTGGQNRAERRLAAILAADVAGYSRLIGADEEGTLDRLRAIRGEVINPKIAEHHGRLVKTTGDGLLVEFASVVDALRCASEVQQAMAEHNTGIAVAERIEFRIGINVGDVVVEDGDIFGDGVNVAARLEALAVPGGICVSARVQEDAAGRLDLAFEDLGEQQLKNIARPVRVFRIGPRASRPHAGGTPAVQPEPALALPDKPSIAVLPFQNMSGDPEQEYFVDGMVEEITTALSRIRWLFVIARNSSFTYKGQAVDVKRVGRELGVRYVLEGSVRKAGNRVRITGQLIDTETGAHLWADRFDGVLEDIFELQDDVASRVAGVIAPAIENAERRHSDSRPTSDLSAYDLFLRAREQSRFWERDATNQALELLLQAIGRDQRYGIALAQAAFCHGMLFVNGWSDDPEINRREGIKFAHQAIQIADNESEVLARAAYVFGCLGEDISTAIALVDRALELNPSYAVGWLYSGWLRIFAGQGDVAIDHFAKASRLSPLEMRSRVLLGVGICQFFSRNLDAAKATLLRSVQQFPRWAPSYRFLAACCAQMGQVDEAARYIQQLQSITSAIVPDALQYRDTQQRKFFLSGLELAAAEWASRRRALP